MIQKLKGGSQEKMGAGDACAPTLSTAALQSLRQQLAARDVDDVVCVVHAFDAGMIDD